MYNAHDDETLNLFVIMIYHQKSMHNNDTTQVLLKSYVVLCCHLL